MARANKAKDPLNLSETLKEATAAATNKVLGLVAEAKNGSDTANTVSTIAKLTAMCEEAADHMAEAHKKLFGGKDSAEAAIDHLDSALQCLNQIADESVRQKAKKPKRVRKAKSA